MLNIKSEKKKYISYSLRIIIAASALYWAFRGEDFGAITDVLLGVNPWVFAAAFGLYIMGQLAFVVRWRLLLRVQEIKISYWPAVRLHFLGLFYNNCLPSSVGGDLIRAWYVTKHTDKKLEAALSVFVDRAIGLTGMAIMALSFYLFIPIDTKREKLEINFGFNCLEKMAEYKWVLIVVGICFVVFATVFASTANGRKVASRWIEVIRKHSLSMLNKVHKSILLYCSGKLAILAALGITFFCQGTFIVGLWMIGREMGMDLNPKYYFIFFPISWFLGILPISIGGLGVVEGGLKVMFGQISTIASEHSLALVLSQRIILLIGSLPGAVIHLIGAHLPKDFFIDYDDTVN